MKFSMFAVLATMFVMASPARAAGFEGATIDCGDHWLSVSIDVKFPESRITMGGDSQPQYSSMAASNLNFVTQNDGQDAHQFYFQALDMIPVSVSVRTFDGKTAFATLTENGLVTEMNCSITPAQVNQN